LEVKKDRSRASSWNQKLDIKSRILMTLPSFQTIQPMKIKDSPRKPLAELIKIENPPKKHRRNTVRPNKIKIETWRRLRHELRESRQQEEIRRKSLAPIAQKATSEKQTEILRHHG
jgi:hypothetical protein